MCYTLYNKQTIEEGGEKQMAQVIYGKLRINYSNQEELIRKVAKHLGIEEDAPDRLIVKALVRAKAEKTAREKRASAEGKETKPKEYVNL